MRCPLATLLSLVLASFAFAQEAAPPASTVAVDPVPELADRLPHLHARLSALVPGDPEAYFLLGEEVAGLARTDAEAELAERLYVLAFELDDPGSGLGLRASVCLALAELTPSSRRARWLRAIAGVVDPRYAEPDWSNAVDPADSPAARYAAARAVGAVRSGDGVRARARLGRPEVRGVIERFSGVLTGAGPSDVLQGLDAEATKWPCPECSNGRLQARRIDGGFQQDLCNTCLGNPGWPLSRDALIATLRFESAMLRGAQRSWGARLAVDLGAPLRDPDPRELAPTYRVDPRAVYWRRGLWTASPPGGANDTGSTP